LQLPERRRPFVKEKDLVDERIMLQQEAAAAMNDASQMRFGKGFPQGLEDDRVGEGVADSGAGEAEDARVRPDFDRLRLGWATFRQAAKNHFVTRGGEAAEEGGHGLL